MRSIEFIGLPGVGKTTLSNAAAASLQRRLPVTVLTQDKATFLAAKDGCEKSLRTVLHLLPEALGIRLFKALGGRTYWQQELVLDFILGNYDFLRSVIEAPAFKKHSLPERKVVFSSLLASAGMLKYLQQSPKEGWVLFDEGILQKSMMFVSSDGTAAKDVVEQYLSRIMLPDVVVNLHTDPKVCLERMLGRSKGLTSRLRIQTAEQVDAFLGHSLEHWEFVASWLAGNTTIPVLHIGTDRDPAELTTYLAAELERVIKEDVPANKLRARI